VGFRAQIDALSVAAVVAIACHHFPTAAIRQIGYLAFGLRTGVSSHWRSEAFDLMLAQPPLPRRTDTKERRQSRILRRLRYEFEGFAEGLQASNAATITSRIDAWPQKQLRTRCGAKAMV
jgi:hypothetical protein